MKTTALASLACAALSVNALAAEGPGPKGIPHLEHVFVIMMENHGYGQIVNNPDEPYLNGLISSGQVSYATNYFAIGHPSLTNYLEIVGGSNFGVRSDNNPNWHNGSCAPNLASGLINSDQAVPANVPSSYKLEGGSVCPIAGTGTDAPTEAVDAWNEVTPPSAAYLANFDGVKSLAAATGIAAKSIADQLVADGKTWRSYQESLPFAGADNVTYSNGTVTDLTAGSLPNNAQLPNVANLANSVFLPGSPIGGYLKLYAAKHNPFVYFQSVQEGKGPMGLANVVPFDGANGLYADLARGTAPALSFIAPNQCNDQHGRGNGDSFCSFDTVDNGGAVGLNPGLIAQGDATLQHIVEAIKASPAWSDGRSAIVVVWDENDYSGVASAPAPGTPFPAANQNQVVLTVETNYRRSPNVTSNVYYNHFSLLRTMEAAFGLPCLNHACDGGVAVMSDLFAAARDD
jgi:phosphatidylinositol-3-phosphatase